jgi:hypothetical protein
MGRNLNVDASALDLTCENRTRQSPPDDRHTPPKQQVAGSSPARGTAAKLQNVGRPPLADTPEGGRFLPFFYRPSRIHRREGPRS